jgi:hypothetical protein
MKEKFIALAVWGFVSSAIVAIITSGVVLYGLFLAFVLTLMIGSLEMRQAIIPGSVLAGFSLYFCLKFYNFLQEKGNPTCLCDECRANADNSDQFAMDVPRTVVLKRTRAKQTKKKTTHI